MLCTAAVDGTVVLQQLDLVRAAARSKQSNVSLGLCLSMLIRRCGIVGWRGCVAQHGCFAFAHVAFATGVLDWLLCTSAQMLPHALLCSISGLHQAVLQLYRLVCRHDSRRSGAHRCSGGRAGLGVVHPFRGRHSVKLRPLGACRALSTCISRHIIDAVRSLAVSAVARLCYARRLWPSRRPRVCAFGAVCCPVPTSYIAAEATRAAGRQARGAFRVRRRLCERSDWSRAGATRDAG